MTPLVRTQLEALKAENPDAEWFEIEGGAIRVVVPGRPLPQGWSKPTTTVHFILPVGFPVATPDCFWTDPDLRLHNNGTPQNTGNTPMPGAPGPLLWFSWHTQSWSPTGHVLQWLRAIMKRFESTT